jgi:hypothetical protein
MTETERLAAIEAIRQVKARYFIGADTGDVAMMRDTLAEDCVLDYTGCFVDPASGRNFLAAYDMVVRGRDQWPTASLKDAGIVSVHQGHHATVDILSETEAKAIFAMTDMFYMPPGAEFSQINGYGLYHEVYVRTRGEWRIRTLTLQRLRVEGL